MRDDVSRQIHEELPDAWPDRLQLWRPTHFFQYAKRLFGFGLGRVELPEGTVLRVPLPGYVLLEFHNLPNGHYSKLSVQAYVKGFEVAMLGTMKNFRALLAVALAGCQRVLDVGCGAGDST